MRAAVGLCVVAAVPLAALAAAAAEDDEADTIVALASDEECSATEDPEACALNALQLRGLRARAESEAKGASEWGSCAAFGCGGKYRKGQACQCNSHCAQYGNCCADYLTKCEAPGVSAHTHSSIPAKGTVHGHPKAGAAYPVHKGFTLALVEEFDEPIDLDTDPIWTWSDGGLIEGGIRFVKENVGFEDGKMFIEVQNRSAKGVDLCSAAEGARLKAKDLTSGEMRARYNQFRYGRYEVRMKAPSVQPKNTKKNGNYIATMFVFRDGKDRHWREIDFEITGDGPGSLTTNVLSADHTIQWKAGIQKSVQHNLPFNDREDFHVYAFEWLPHSITWYVDGKQIRQFKGSHHVKIPDLSGKIMMNTWMYDERALFGGPEIENNRFPLRTEYDWFRFYKWDGDKKYPCPGLGHTCLTKDDRFLAKNNPCDGIVQEGMKFGRPPCKTHCHR